MRSQLLYLLIFLLLGSPITSQIVIKGKIVDEKTGDPSIGCIVFSKQNNVATETNEFGEFELNITTPDSIKIYGEGIKNKILWIEKSDFYEIKIDQSITTLENVTITGNKENPLETTQMSVNEYTAEQIKEIPAIFGEPDVLRVIQLKPGVQINGEGSNSITVRGGGPDQNLVLLDDGVVYNPTHLFGFFSVFNSDVIKKVKVYKGDFPAIYGGRLSSVIDVQTKSPNKDSITGSGGLGLISSRLNIELPIIKNRLSVFLGARRTYFDVFTNAINKINEKTPGWDPIPAYHFQDLNAKLDLDLNAKNKFFTSFFLSKDKLLLQTQNLKFKLAWGNSTNSLKWNHIFNSKLLMSTSFTYSNYKYAADSKFSSFSFEVGSNINELGVKNDFEYEINKKTSINWGIQGKRYLMELGRLNGGSDSTQLNISTPTSFSDAAIYANCSSSPLLKLKVESGLRINYVNNKKLNFWGLEPRITFAYRATLKSAFKLSFSRVYQNVHLVANSASSLPIDYWYPTTSKILPQYANQITLGINKDLYNGFIFSYEIFYKQLKRQVDFKNNANLYFNENIENEMIIGKGWACGGEAYIEKKIGILTGWLGYTLSWSKRKFKEINDGKSFFARNDRRHDISIVLMTRLSKRLSLSGTWVYSSGIVTTLPLGKIILQGFENETISVAPDYSYINNYRIPPYHRLDLGLIYKFNRKWGESDLTLSLFNAYSRRNTYFIAFETVPGNINYPAFQSLKAKSVSLFPLIPSITYNFKF